jgi:hypothetical protein
MFYKTIIKPDSFDFQFNIFLLKNWLEIVHITKETN